MTDTITIERDAGKAGATAATVHTTRGTKRPPWEEPPTTVGQAARGLTLGGVLLIVLIPLWIIVVTSFSTPAAINRAGGLVLWPAGLTVEPYREMLGDPTVRTALLVSLGITGVGTALSMVVSVLCAYGLSRIGSLGHRWLLMLLLATMFFGAGLIPTYLLVQALGLTDTYLALILPSAVSVFNILVLRAFYSDTSAELIEAARIDGAGDWRILWSVVLPTSRAVTAVIALFYAVGYWNSFFNVLLYLPTDSVKWPLQYVLYTYVNQGNGLPGSIKKSRYHNGGGCCRGSSITLNECCFTLATTFCIN